MTTTKLLIAFTIQMSSITALATIESYQYLNTAEFLLIAISESGSVRKCENELLHIMYRINEYSRAIE